MTRTFSAITLVLCLGGFGLNAAGVRAEAPRPLEPLAFLIGEWAASGSGSPGAGTGSATFARGLQDRVIIRTSYAEYPATQKAPASRHDDLMIIHEAGNGRIEAEYYDNEGHVIHYVVTVPAPGEAVFLGVASSGAPRFRLAYKLGSDGLLRGQFDIAPPGKPEAFTTYLVWESRKAASASAAKPQ